MLSMRHISHSMLGHTVALPSLEKTVNAFTVFSQVYYRHIFVKNILASCFLAQIVANRETRLFSLFLGLGDKNWQIYDENQTISWYLVASANRSESWTKVHLV